MSSAKPPRQRSRDPDDREEIAEFVTRQNDPDPTPPPEQTRSPSGSDRPTHPPLAAALLMLGVVAFLVVISILAVI